MHEDCPEDIKVPPMGDSLSLSGTLSLISCSVGFSKTGTSIHACTLEFARGTIIQGLTSLLMSVANGGMDSSNSSQTSITSQKRQH